MRLFTIILVSQIFIGGILLHFSSNSPDVQHIKHSVKQVLGISLIADDTSSPQSDQPIDTPVPDNPTQPPADNTLNSPNPTDTPTNQFSSPTETQMPSAVNPTTSEVPAEIPTDTPTPEVSQLSPTLEVQSTDTPTPTSAVETNNVSTFSTSILNPEDVVSTPENISSSVVNNAQKEDQLVQGTQDPQQKATLLTNFADNSLPTISDNLKSQDFSTVSYLVQRLSADVEQTQSIVSNTNNAITNQQVKQKLATFCNQADSSLKTQQLQVPENLEQDIEIVRGDCLITQ